MHNPSPQGDSVQANIKEPSPSELRGPLPRWLRSRPKGALLFAFRLPIYLYRLKLGWSLGHHFLLLVHKDRKSGLLHQTVLEVVRYDPATEESVVLSARGEKADHRVASERGNAAACIATSENSPFYALG